jgi:hypothetical protein
MHTKCFKDHMRGVVCRSKFVFPHGHSFQHECAKGPVTCFPYLIGRGRDGFIRARQSPFQVTRNKKLVSEESQVLTPFKPSRFLQIEYRVRRLGRISDWVLSKCNISRSSSCYERKFSFLTLWLTTCLCWLARVPLLRQGLLMIQSLTDTL